MATVTVACKLPHGLILRNFKMVPHFEPVLGGGMRETTKAEQVGPDVRINGYTIPFGQQAECLIVGGYAMTPNIDADFFAEWMRANAESDLVKNNLIHGNAKPDAVDGMARDRLKLRSGLEPIDPTKLPTGISPAKAA